MRDPSSIVTVTLNPAIDETVFLDVLRPGAVNRAKRHHRQPGGKGVNVSVMLAGFGIPSTASGFLGWENPGVFEGLFDDGMIRDGFLRIAGETRTGIKIVSESTHETTDLNFSGLVPKQKDLDVLLEKVESMAKPGIWFVIGGRLPDGVRIDYFKRLIETLKRAGSRIVVDTSGEPLKVAIESGVDVIKPNHHELEEILGHALPDTKSRVAAARSLQSEKVPHVILSLGGEGALFVSPESVLLAEPPPVRVVSTVGAGDSLLAGYLAGLVTGLSPEDRAKLATVFAWSALEDVSRHAPSAETVAERMPRIVVRSVAG